jgi:hypothetical protein
MHKHFLAVFLLISQVAFAGTFSTLKLDNIVANFGRTEYFVEKYDLSLVNWGKEINIIKRNHTSESCGESSVSLSRQEALDSLENYYQEGDLSYELRNLVKRKKIVKAIFGSDGSDGESEYCSTATMKFYSVDGEVLTLYFDYNT